MPGIETEKEIRKSFLGPPEKPKVALLSTIDSVSNGAMEVFEAWVHEQLKVGQGSVSDRDKLRQMKEEAVRIAWSVTVRNRCKDVHAFGCRKFLVYAVSHLLRNPIEEGFSRGLPLGSIESEIILDIREEVVEGHSRVVFGVCSPQDLSEEDIVRCFESYGGLMTQKRVIQDWGGDLTGVPLDEKQTEFRLETDAIRVTKEDER